MIAARRRGEDEALVTPGRKPDGRVASFRIRLVTLQGESQLRQVRWLTTTIIGRYRAVHNQFHRNGRNRRELKHDTRDIVVRDRNRGLGLLGVLRIVPRRDQGISAL